MQDYELIDHTADLGIILRAPHPPALFACAAHALFDLICDLDQVAPSRTVPLALHSEALDSLMIAWLNELIFLHETGRWLFKSFDLRIDEGSELSAQAQGEVFDPLRHTIHRGIKAATYHQLEVRKDGELWTARIIFDV